MTGNPSFGDSLRFYVMVTIFHSSMTTNFSDSQVLEDGWGG